MTAREREILTRAMNAIMLRLDGLTLPEVAVELGITYNQVLLVKSDQRAAYRVGRALAALSRES